MQHTKEQIENDFVFIYDTKEDFDCLRRGILYINHIVGYKTRKGVYVAKNRYNGVTGLMTQDYFDNLVRLHKERIGANVTILEV